MVSVTALKGGTDPKSDHGKISLTGGIEATSDTGAILRTDGLEYTSKEQKFTSTSKFIYTDSESSLEGDALEGDVVLQKVIAKGHAKLIRK